MHRGNGGCLDMVTNAIRHCSPSGRALLICAATLIPAEPAVAQAGEILTLYDGTGGVTCHYFNVAGRVPWRNRLGDWKDANDKNQGATPFARTTVRDLDKTQIVEWDIT
jgi:hypothetical protein